MVSALDEATFRDWVAARSVARDLPAPVADRGGWRVETGSETEIRRYFFARPDEAIANLAREIAGPRIFLKLAADAATMAALLPDGWVTEGQTWMMSGAPIAMPSLHPDYRLEQEGDARRATVVIRAPDGSVAASGYGAAVAGVFAYDRIVTDAAHYRRGLGRVVMAALGGFAAPDATHVLAATAMGRGLYESIGWRVRSDYTTAFIPDG
jgi:GNAT superfamily N-acetyltransferase